MLDYIINSGLCLAFFYGFYKLVLEREKNHRLKRFYLLGILILSFGIPFITFTSYSEVLPQPIVETIPQTIFEPSGDLLNFKVDKAIMAPTLESNYTPIILWTIYLIGVILFSTRLIYNLITIYFRIISNKKQQYKKFTHVLLQELVAPHTFFHYIFFNKNKFESNEIPKEVHLHEQAHANQKHSLDILLIEILKVVFWFNPLIYFIKHSIKLNHEFLADQAVLNNGIATNTYQQILLSFTNKQPSTPFVNAINYSSIKKRFTVMKTPRSTNKSWVKSILILPLIAVLLLAFSQKETIIKQSEPPQNTVEDSPDTTKTKSPIVTQEMIDDYQILSEILNSQSKDAPITEKVVTKMWQIYDAMSTTEKKAFGPKPVANEKEIKSLLNNYSEELTLFLNSNREDNSQLLAIKNQLDDYYKELTREQMVIFKLGPVLPLPAIKQPPPPPKKTNQNKTIEIVINKNGDYLVNGEYSSLQILEEKLTTRTENEKKILINTTIKSDIETNPFVLSQLRNVLRENGITKISYTIHTSKPIVSTNQINYSINLAKSKSFKSEEVPIYPGCIGNNEELRNCYNKSVQRFIARKFNADLTRNLGLSPGKKKIYIQYKINKTGEVEFIEARAPHQALKDEAKRLINLMPKMTPGKQNGKIVVTTHMIPISFSVGELTVIGVLNNAKNTTFKNTGKEPLIIFDGKKFKKKSLENLETTSIAKINVLKGDAAIQKYGNDGKNGVIEVTSKKAIVQKNSSIVNPEDIPFAILDEYPIYPGCSGTNEEIKKCFNLSIQKHISRKFNPKLAKELDLPPGKKEIHSQIRITKTGKFEIVKIKSPHESLDKEIKRLVSLFPKVIPGKKNGIIVDALCLIPISFNIE